MISKYLVWPLIGLSFSFINPCSQTNKAKSLKANDKIYEVAVVAPEFSTVAQDFEVDGVFDVNAVTTVTASSLGEVAEILVDVGDSVQKDDPLVVLSNTQLLELIDLKRARVKEYESRLKDAQSRITRNYGEDSPATVEDTLFLDEEPTDEMIEQKNYGNTSGAPQNKPASLKTLSEMLETTADSLNKQADALDRKLLNLTHLSPVAGIVTQIHASTGNGIREQDKLIDITQMDPMSVSFFLPDTVANFIDKHSKVKVSPLDVPDITVEGEVYFISPNIDTATGKFEVRAHVANPNMTIKGGQKATVRVATRKMDRVIVLPKQVLHYENGKTYVFIVFKDQAKLVEVDASEPDDKGNVKISGQLKVDDVIIINRPMELVHNSYVKVIAVPENE